MELQWSHWAVRPTCPQGRQARRAAVAPDLDGDRESELLVELALEQQLAQLPAPALLPGSSGESSRCRSGKSFRPSGCSRVSAKRSTIPASKKKICRKNWRIPIPTCA